MFLPESRVNCRQHNFVIRVVKVWNNLPADVVCANSVSVFVHKLKSVDFSQFLIGKDFCIVPYLFTATCKWFLPFVGLSSRDYYYLFIVVFTDCIALLCFNY